MNEALRKSALPKNKYNFPLLHNTEVLTGLDADRQPSDMGMEQEHYHQ